METGTKPIFISFLRLFHSVLKIVLLSVLDFSPDLHTELQTEYDRLQNIANKVGERVKAYKMCIGTSKA